MRIALLILLLSTNTFAQNYYQFIRKGSVAKVQRTVTKEFIDISKKIIKARIESGQFYKEIRAKQIQPIQRPMQVPGSVGYLKGAARAFKDTPQWEKVYESGGYNGAHHIVTKHLLEELGLNGEAITNAPGVLHPLHNNKYFDIYFHDHDTQKELYEQGGIKLILENFFKCINDINEALGYPRYNREFIENEMFEAEIWAKYWGLKWE